MEKRNVEMEINEENNSNAFNIPLKPIKWEQGSVLGPPKHIHQEHHEILSKCPDEDI